MRFTAKTQIALRLLLHLAREGNGEQRVQGRELAQQQQLNDAYLEQVMIPLRQASMVQTLRGRNGGYQLARDPSKISLLEIVEVFEGALDLASESVPNTVGGGRERVAADQVWRDLSEQLKVWLAAISLQSILERERSGLTFTI
jgi:Rrf2 family protein